MALPILIKDHFSSYDTNGTLEDAIKEYKVSHHESNNLFHATTEQSGSSVWFDHKKFRVGSSQIHTVVRAHQTNKKSLIREATQSITMTKVNNSTYLKKAMSHGIFFEPIIKEIYQIIMSKKHTDFEYENFGVVVDPKHPFLASSIDGLAKCSCCKDGPRIVEIKAPYRLRHQKINQIKKKDPNFIVDRHGKLRTNHRYFDQVQYQMAILDGYDSVDLVVYTGIADFSKLSPSELGQHLLIENIKRDHHYGDMQIKTANIFLREYVYPDLFLKPTG